MKILKYFSAVLLGFALFASGAHIGAEMRYEYVTAHTVGGERYGEVRNEKAMEYVRSLDKGGDIRAFMSNDGMYVDIGVMPARILNDETERELRKLIKVRYTRYSGHDMMMD